MSCASEPDAEPLQIDDIEPGGIGQPDIAPPNLQCPTIGGCCDLLPDEPAMSNCFIATIPSGQCGYGSCRRADCTIAVQALNSPIGAAVKTAYCSPAVP
jgi:hypothetical protein